MSFTLKYQSRLIPNTYYDIEGEKPSDKPKSSTTVNIQGEQDKQSKIKDDITTINSQEKLSKKLESLETYGMSSFFNSLSSEQQIIFVNELSKIGVSTDDIDISGARCNTMSYKGNDGNIVSGSILSIVGKNGRIEFPDLQSCGKPGSMNVNQYFQMLSELNHFTIPLEKGEAQDILNKLKNTSAKEFLETGDENLFNQVYTHFNKSELIKNGITEMILSKIIELYGKNPDFYDIFNPPNTISITTRIDDKTGRKEFFLKNIKNGGGFYFGP